MVIVRSHYLTKLITVVGILYCISGLQSIGAMGAGFEPYFRLVKEKQGRISVKKFVTWYEHFWDAHKDQYIDFLVKEYERQTKLLGVPELSPHTLAENAFDRERNRYTYMSSVKPLTQEGFPAEIQALVMYFPPSPFEPEFRTQLWRWLQEQ